MAKSSELSGLGIVGVIFGAVLILVGFLFGMNFITIGLGLVFFVLGAAARKTIPTKTCPFCQSEINPAAVVCPHCQREQPKAAYSGTAR